MNQLESQWQSAFLRTLQKSENANPLKDAATNEKLAQWTQMLTKIVVESFRELGWHASAKGHQLETLPIRRSEYLSLDAIAFPKKEKRWSFPIAVVELENSKDDDQVAYSLWKVFCIQADLRIVFCYRQESEGGSDLVRFLRDEVVLAMDLESRTNLVGQTIVVVGTKGAAETFPYGFFKWWILEKNTSTFKLM